MTDLTLYAAAVLAVTVVWLLDRNGRLADQLETERVETAAAEADLRAAGGSRRVHWRRPARGCGGFTYHQTIPTAVDLALWDAEVDGLPWGRATDGLPADVVADPDGCTPRLSLTAPVSTARLRRLVAMEAA